MNHSVYYSNKDSDDIASETWPDLLCTMEDSYPSVPQSTHPSQIFSHGYHTVGSYVPDINAADPYPSVPQSTYPDQVFASGCPTVGSYVPQFNTANYAAFSLPPATEMEAFANLLPLDLHPRADFTTQDVIDPWSMPALSSNANFVVSQPQPVDNQYWTGVDPLATYSVATTPDAGVSPTSNTSVSQEDWALLSDFLQSPCTTQDSSPGHGGEARRVAPEHGASASEVITSPVVWDASGFSWPIPAAPGEVRLNATETFAPAAALGKRRREAEQPLGVEGPAGTHAHVMPPSKRARGGKTAKGIPKAARSAARTRRKPVARIPEQQINSKPKEAGRGAERLATPSSQGIYHQSLPGPSFQQGWAVDATNGRPTWVEGSVEEEAVHHIDSTVQQQQGEATEHFKIPRIFEPEHRLFLQSSKADIARGAVQAIKCRVCPDANLRNFDEFKRHYRTSEAHPQKLHFCDRCGDYFGRSDALKRHRDSQPRECNADLKKAVEKRRTTEEAHTVFMRHLKDCLATDAAIERTFSQIIKDMYPGSSKKRTGGSK